MGKACYFNQLFSVEARIKIPQKLLNLHARNEILSVGLFVAYASQQAGIIGIFQLDIQYRLGP